MAVYGDSFRAELWRLHFGLELIGECNMCDEDVTPTNFYYDNFSKTRNYEINKFKILCEDCHRNVMQIGQRQPTPPAYEPPYKNFKHRFLNSEFVVVQYKKNHVLVKRESPYTLICLVSEDLKYYRNILYKFRSVLLKEGFGNDHSEDTRKRAYKLGMLDYDHYLYELIEILKRRFIKIYFEAIRKLVNEQRDTLEVGIFKTIYDKITQSKLDGPQKPRDYKDEFKITIPDLLAEVKKEAKRDQLLLRFV